MDLVKVKDNLVAVDEARTAADAKVTDLAKVKVEVEEKEKAGKAEAFRAALRLYSDIS